MIQTLRRGANVVLFVIACLLAADTANAVFAAIVLPPPERAAESAAAEPVAAAQWTDRQAILDRNVFASATLAPEVQTRGDVPEELEATQLPLTLLGTAASQDPRFAWSAIQDRDQKTTLILGIGGSIQDKATVVRIERQRVVLLEGGVHRELTFDEEELTPRLASAAPAAATGPAARRAEAITKAQQRRAARLQRLAETAQPAEDSFQVPADQIQAAIANPAELFSQARILPKYEEGQMRGVQISQIKPGSLFEQMGLQEGDLVTEINGIPIDSPEQSARVLQEFSSGKPLNIGGIGADGQPRSFTTQGTQ
jgi:general secretion pathway protein C